MKFEPDYIIIGAGAAGAVLAARLAEDKDKKVLLIEAGPDNSSHQHIASSATWIYLADLPKYVSPDGSPSCWSFKTVPQNGKIYGYPRGTGLGGSVNHHALVDGRGSPVIYDQWAKELGDSSWSSANLDYYFKKMENFDAPKAKKEAHGQDGWLHIKQSKLREPFHHDLVDVVTNEFGYKFRDDFYDDPTDYSGIGPHDTQVHNDGRRSYVITDLLFPRQKENQEKGWNNLEILTDKLVTKIIFEGNRAVGVEVIDAARAYRADKQFDPKSKDASKSIYRAKKEIILSGGSVNTPQILMLSGIGPKADLEKLGIKVIKDAPGVGKHLQDHMEVNLVYEIKNLPNKVWLGQAALLSLSDPEWGKYAEMDALTENGMIIVWEAFSDYDARDKRRPDLHVHTGHFYFRDFNFNPEVFDDPDPLKGGYIHNILKMLDPKNPTAYFNFLTETVMTNAQSGSIKLASTDPTLPPKIDLCLHQEEADITRLALAIQMQRKLMKSPKMQKYESVEVLPGPEYETLDQLKEYISHYSAFGHHMTGTAKMGRVDDPMAVVDSNLKVIGVEGLRICDASVFPSIPGYNTSRASYMVAEVLSDKMKKE